MSDNTQTPAVLEHIEENLVKITLTISPQRFEEGLHHAYLKNRNQIALPGFRKGRAPRKMIEMQFGREIFHEDALDFVFPDAYDAAITEHDLDVVSAPQVDFEEKDGGAIIFAEVHTRPQPDIEDYTGITYTKTDIEVTDEEIDTEIDRDRQKNARVTTVTDRAVQDSDIAVIDFEGFIDDVAFNGGKGEKFELAIGSKSFIDGFEEQIIGKNINDEFDVSVSFPTEYHAEELAGKPAVFKVKIHEIKHKELPVADDEFAQEVSEFNTLAEYKADIKEKITKQKTMAADREIENQLVKGLCDRITVNIPKPMIDNETDRLLREFANRIQSQGMDFGKYMEMTGMDVTNLRNMYQEQANINVTSRLAIDAVVRKEVVEISDEEYSAEIDRLAKMYSIQREKLEESIGVDEAAALRLDIKARKALDMVKAAAVAVAEEAK
ncbi:MAG: trigger factor [Defluviitaleaceae bacterium]|nr:trigger factor [Defluviitaleaceae bacterium]